MEQISPDPLFDLGDVVVTPAAAAELARANQDLDELLELYCYGDFGRLSRDDEWRNAHAIEFGGGRIQGRYELWTREVIWVTTEPDRRTTTILLPEEW